MPRGMRAPYGYTTDWEIDEKTSADILLIFQYACAGRSYLAMLNKLPGWNQDKIYYYIQQDVYTGVARYNKKGVPQVDEGHHPAIISREVFEAVQVMQQMNLLNRSRRLFTETELVVLDYAWQIGVKAWGEETMLKLLEAELEEEACENVEEYGVEEESE